MGLFLLGLVTGVLLAFAVREIVLARVERARLHRHAQVARLLRESKTRQADLARLKRELP
jgi:hypothetical protein